MAQIHSYNSDYQLFLEHLLPDFQVISLIEIDRIFEFEIILVCKKKIQHCVIDMMNAIFVRAHNHIKYVSLKASIHQRHQWHERLLSFDWGKQQQMMLSLRSVKS